MTALLQITLTFVLVDALVQFLFDFKNFFFKIFIGFLKVYRARAYLGLGTLGLMPRRRGRALVVVVWTARCPNRELASAVGAMAFSYRRSFTEFKFDHFFAFLSVEGSAIL